MTAKSILLTGMSLVVLLGSSLPCRADDIDEKQKTLLGNINTAAANKTITTKDAGSLRKQLADFRKRKAALKSSHGDVLRTDDANQLDQELNVINQDFESKKKAKSGSGSDSSK